jgi:uncharacterized protein YndB with AHSA1/START domain
MTPIDKKTLTVTTPSDTEILMTRTFDAPRRLVYDALTKPELLSRWYSGPPGTSLVVCEVDLRVGGKYRYVWRKGNGFEFAMSGEFMELVPGERHLCTERFEGQPGEAFVTTTLTEEGAAARFNCTIRFASQDIRDMVLKSGMERGAAMSYDRMAELLVELSKELQ